MTRFDDLPIDASLTAIYGQARKIFEEQVKRDARTDYTDPEAFNTAIWFIAEKAQHRGFVALRGQPVGQIASGIGGYIGDLRSRAEVYARPSEFAAHRGIDLHATGNEPVPAPSHSVDQTESLPSNKNTLPLDLLSGIHMRIDETPLTAHNLTTIVSSLTELSTKYWLIAKDRFADLIEYTQTHNGRFAEEAHVVITKASYNSPFNMDWKVDLSAPSIAEALVTTIDGIVQVRKRLEQADLTNQAKVQEIKHTEQQADHEQQMAALEREQQRLELEQHRLEILEKQLEVQKKSIEYALEIAEKVVDLLRPGADPAARAMAIQSLLPNLVQLQNGKGLEPALPTSTQP